MGLVADVHNGAIPAIAAGAKINIFAPAWATLPPHFARSLLYRELGKGAL